jgi:large subunit ribosomal protein L9
MKVILTADLAHVGNVGQVVEVADGYGRNYLIPRGFAILATPGNERSLAQQQRARLAREAKNKAEAEALAAQLQALIHPSRRWGRTKCRFACILKWSRRSKWP